MICDIYIYIILLLTCNLMLNWIYQILYYDIRMFLVFVLHSFSIGSFGTLYTEISYNNWISSLMIYGILGLGMILYISISFYLCIQLYVYISFSITFLSTCIITIFNNDLYYKNNEYTISLCLLIPITIVDMCSISILSYYIFLSLYLVNNSNTISFYSI